MKTILIFFLALFAYSRSEEEKYPRKRRGSFQATYPIGANQLHIGGVDAETYGKTQNIPLQEDLYAPGIGNILPIPQYNQEIINLNVGPVGGKPLLSQLDQLHQIPAIAYANSNAVDKPVQEPQEYIPPQSTGTAIIPLMPPPAVPVNAVASNVPINQGSVFLGSGSLGVIDLGGGAYALGSGAIGYSERRSNPRTSLKQPLLPPILAAPNLIPAAVSRPQPPQTPPIEFDPFLGSDKPITDQNGYEYLQPNRVGFGEPLMRYRPLKIRMAFATPSNVEIRPQFPAIDPQYPAVNYDQRVANLYSPRSYIR